MIRYSLSLIAVALLIIAWVGFRGISAAAEFISPKRKEMTDAEREAYYRADDRYKKAVEELLEIEEELEFTKLAYQEIAWTRKKALENLVTLHGQQYFAGPSVPRDLAKEWEKKKEEQRKASNAKVKINRTKRKEGK